MQKYNILMNIHIFITEDFVQTTFASGHYIFVVQVNT